jgi:hypothetical protein
MERKRWKNKVMEEAPQMLSNSKRGVQEERLKK